MQKRKIRAKEKHQTIFKKLLKLTKTNFGSIAIVLTSLVLLTIYITISTGAWKKEPTVSVKPENCYTETIRVVTDKDYRPYSYIGADGKPAGYDIELIYSIANKMKKNLKLELIPWSEALDALENKTADILMTCDSSDVFNYEPSPLKTTVTSIDDYVLFGKEHIKNFDEVLALKNRVGYMIDGNAENVLAKMDLLDKCIGFSSNKDILLAIENGEIDAGVMRYSIGTMILKDLGFNSIKGQFSIGHSYMCFTVNPDHPELVDQINSAFNELRATGEVTKLYEKWLTTFVQPKSPFDVLHEQNWLVILILFFVSVIFILRTMTRQKQRSLFIIESLTNDYEYVFLLKFKKNEGDNTFYVLRNSGFIPSPTPEKGSLSLLTEYLHRFVQNYIVTEDKQRVATMVERETVLSHIADEKDYSVPFRGMIEGEKYYLLFRFIAIKNATGKVVNCVVGLKNVDEETKKVLHQTEELEEARRSAELASTAKTEFLFNMSHDIRTPMNAILGYTEVAKKHLKDTEKITDYLRKIEIAGHTLIELINQVLEMSRIESGHCELCEGDFDIEKRSKEIASIFEAIATSKNITLTTDFSRVQNPLVYSDAVRFTQIISNILSNAFKYTPNNGNITFTLMQEVCEKQNTANYLISIKDTGIGMSPEYLEHIFDNFSRERNSTTSGIPGTGLGMSIVKRLVDLFGGTISIQSEKGKGTKIDITLPLQYREKSEISDKNSQQDASSVLSKLKILLVDDNEMNREITTEILEEFGVNVISVSDGDIAVETIRNSTPGDFDLVLMDVQMPRMNGYDATKAIRALENKKLSSVPIVALTANAFKEDHDLALEAGMDDHITKPIDIDIMTKTIINIMQK